MYWGNMKNKCSHNKMPNGKQNNTKSKLDACFWIRLSLGQMKIIKLSNETISLKIRKHSNA